MTTFPYHILIHSRNVPKHKDNDKTSTSEIRWHNANESIISDDIDLLIFTVALAISIVIIGWWLINKIQEVK